MKYVIIASLLLLLALPLSAADASALAGRQKSFVMDLFSQKRYFDAIAETRRLMAFDSRIGLNPDYEFFINANYFLGGQYGTAVKNITAKPGPLDPREGILLSQSYLKLGMNADSLAAACAISYKRADASARYALLARKAEAYLECGKYGELLDEITAAERYIGEREKIARLRDEVARYGGLRRRSVPLAVALSVFIPGAGQMYAGRYLSGAMSFLGVAAAAGGACYFHRREMNDLAYVFIFLSSLLYAGNIYGAFNAAQSANLEAGSAYRETVRKKCIPEYDPAADARIDSLFPRGQGGDVP